MPDEAPLTPADRERLQLDAITRWDAMPPWVQQRRLNAARRREGLPVPETRAEQRRVRRDDL